MLNKKNKINGTFEKKQFAKIQSSMALKILNEFKYGVTASVDNINNAKAGEIYIFYTEDVQKYDDFTCDNFNWLNQGTFKTIPKDYPLVFKSYY